MNALNPFQTPRLDEIRSGKKFWGYLDTEPLQMRYVLAAHFLRGVEDVVEIGGYRNNVITNFLTGHHRSVTVYSLDEEFEAMTADVLNGAACRIRHVRDFFQNHEPAAAGYGLVALGLEIHGPIEPFCALVRDSSIAVLEVPVSHQPSADCLDHVLRSVPSRLRCRIDLDFSANEALLRDELAQTNMNRPFWLRNVYVLDRQKSSAPA
jgi:hypothetical protein